MVKALTTSKSEVWYVYIVECSDKTLYTGITTDVIRRVKEHNESKRGAKYTKTRRPVTLMKQFTCSSKSEALKLEYKIKQLPKEEKLKFNV